jgi:hypothetical protein
MRRLYTLFWVIALFVRADLPPQPLHTSAPMPGPQDCSDIVYVHGKHFTLGHQCWWI